MLAVLILATIVEPPKQKAVPKAVTHEEPHLVGKNVPLLKQHPRFHKQIVTVVDQVANIIKRPKLLVKENPVEKPVIHHRRVVHKKKVHVPRPIIRTKVIAVPQPHIVHKPYHRVKTDKIPKPIPKPELRIVNRDRPFPVENLVIRKRPRVVEHPYDKPIPIVEEITNVIRKPIVHHKKVPYYPKAHGGNQAGGAVQVVAAGGDGGYGQAGYGMVNQGIEYNGGQIYDAGLWSRATILSLDVNNLPILVASLAEFTWHQLIEIVAKHAV
ncbi:unnamed protein product [Mytilus edulis]|uniref:Uncharacterized protein n=1 Tax=Mytilus edulis TaxID=6550 RepID=A0A8S3TNM1_MYTED|nr:unnamed protein product [Mytilus edulis]